MRRLRFVFENKRDINSKYKEIRSRECLAQPRQRGWFVLLGEE